MGKTLSTPYKKDTSLITDGTELTIWGTLHKNCDSFSVSLCSGPLIETDDIAFHFNPRFIEFCVQRNHKEASKWGAEENAGGFPFQRGQDFRMNLLVNQRGYKVVVNDKHFCEFTHRLQKTEVRCLHIRGDLFIRSIEDNSCAQQSLRDVGYSSVIEGGISSGMKIVILGQVKENCDSFAISLCVTPTTSQGDIAFTFAPSFIQKCVARNSRKSSKLGTEMREGILPFVRGKDFSIDLQVTDSCYTVFVDDKYFCDFPHRLSKDRMQYLVITGDVLISSVHFDRQNIIKQIEASKSVRATIYRTTDSLLDVPVYPLPNHPAIEVSEPVRKDITRISDGTELVIYGTPYRASDSFSVSLCFGPLIETDDIAFHFNPRFLENCVMRNHKEASKWGAEEKTGGFPFQRGTEFSMSLLVNQRNYKIVVNDKHFCEFTHRLEKTGVRYLHIRGDLFIRSIEQNSCPQQSLRDATYSSLIEGGISSGMKIVILGQVKENCDSFAVSLCVTPTTSQGDIAFTFAPSFTQKCVVRNSWKSSKLDTEMREGILPFERGKDFSIDLQVTDYCYTVYVNDKYFCDFPHRLSKDRVQYLIITGDVIISSVQFDGQNIIKQDPDPPAFSEVLSESEVSKGASGPIYNPNPDPPAYSDVLCEMEASKGASGPTYNPPTPVTVKIPGGFHLEKIVCVRGVVKAGCIRFYVDLVCGLSSDIALRFDVRVNYGTDHNIIGCSHKENAIFGIEEIYERSSFPFMPGSKFEIKLLCKPECIKVSVNREHFCDFNHRIDPIKEVDHIHVAGDVTLSEISWN
ncbi:galectin [Plakobranchus ocellatus]|uniref:Galectin n=1 Tax=Plakobranchus ocellatus TaxID=259542 RepID=A0AAV4DF52_9GAST|nr:galectin [Plakobranchus ocellatus]